MKTQKEHIKTLVSIGPYGAAITSMYTNTHFKQVETVIIMVYRSL